MELGTWAAWVSCIISTTVTIILWRKTRGKRLISFQVLFDQKMTSPDWKGLSLSIEGESLESPRQVGAIFYNDGTVTLKQDQIFAELGLSVEAPGIPIYAVATERNPAGDRVNEVAVSIVDSRALIDKHPLNPGDSLFLNLIVDRGSPGDGVKVLGKAEDFEIREAPATDSRWSRYIHAWRDTRYLLLVVLLITFVVGVLVGRPHEDRTATSSTDPQPGIVVTASDTDQNQNVRVQAKDLTPRLLMVGPGAGVLGGGAAAGLGPTYWAFVSVNKQLIAARTPCTADSTDQIACTIVVKPIAPGTQIVCWVAEVGDIIPILASFKDGILPIDTPDGLSTSISEPFSTKIGRYVTQLPDQPSSSTHK